jgi:carbonic anhydrase
MDPRCEPTQFLGGDIFFGTVKNAGGRATLDAVRSIVTLRSLNTVSEGGTVAVIHHTGKYGSLIGRQKLLVTLQMLRLLTDCGMTHLSEEDIKADIKKRTPAEALRGSSMEFGTFGADEFEDTIKKDVETLKNEKLLQGMDVLGFAFITETGELRPVV